MGEDALDPVIHTQVRLRIMTWSMARASPPARSGCSAATRGRRPPGYGWGRRRRRPACRRRFGSSPPRQWPHGRGILSLPVIVGVALPCLGLGLGIGYSM